MKLLELTKVGQAICYINPDSIEQITRYEPDTTVIRFKSGEVDEYKIKISELITRLNKWKP